MVWRFHKCGFNFIPVFYKAGIFMWITLVVKPSTKKKSKLKAESEGFSLSEVVENLLYDYSAE